jgi:hypothetical protein
MEKYIQSNSIWSEQKWNLWYEAIWYYMLKIKSELYARRTKKNSKNMGWKLRSTIKKHWQRVEQFWYKWTFGKKNKLCKNISTTRSP